MVIEVIGLLEGDGHCVPEREKQHGYRNDWFAGRRWVGPTVYLNERKK